MSWSRRTYSLYSYVFRRRFQDVLIKANIFVLVIRLQDVFKTSCKNIFKTSSGRLQDVFKTPSRRFEDVFKTSSKLLQDILQRCLQDAFKTYHTVLVNKFSSCLSRRIHNVSEPYCKDGYLQKDLPRSHFWEIYGQCTKFARVKTVSQVLIFHFTTPFVGCLKRRI